MKKRRGFTLIELLVVIAIIAVLMGILMPALRRVREQARMISCTANMKHWGTTFHMRATENDGKLYSGVNDRGYWWINDLDEKDWDWTENKTWLCPTAVKPVRDKFGNNLLTFNIFNAWGIFMSGSGKNYGPNGIMGSYSINGYLLNIPDGAEYEGGVKAEDGWRSFHEIKQAANVPMYVDALRFDLWPLPNQAPAQSEESAWSGNNMGRCCINRHGGFVCISFADGSARKVGLKELYVLKWYKTWNMNGPYTLAGDVQGDDWPAWIRKYQEF